MPLEAMQDKVAGIYAAHSGVEKKRVGIDIISIILSIFSSLIGGCPSLTSEQLVRFAKINPLRMRMRIWTTAMQMGVLWRRDGQHIVNAAIAAAEDGAVEDVDALRAEMNDLHDTVEENP